MNLPEGSLMSLPEGSLMTGRPSATLMLKLILGLAGTCLAEPPELNCATPPSTPSPPSSPPGRTAGSCSVFTCDPAGGVKLKLDAAGRPNVSAVNPTLNAGSDAPTAKTWT